jgi:hypothetical protein
MIIIIIRGENFVAHRLRITDVRCYPVFCLEIVKKAGHNQL